MDKTKQLARELFNKEYVDFVESTFFIEEKKKDGRGKCFFQAAKHTLLINMNEHTLWALKSQQCADGAFVHFDEQNQATLYLLEMKSGLDIKKFGEDVLAQFQGMYLSTLAILALLNLPKPQQIYAIIAFSKNKIDEPNSHIFTKQLVGEKSIVQQKFIPFRRIWNNGQVPLPYQQTAKLVKRQRVCAENCGEINCPHDKNADFVGVI